MNKPNNYKSAWEESYARGENNILYPQAEVIRFLNRYVCKQNSDRSADQIIKTSKNRPLKGLDFACGVGTHGIAFADFGIEPYGVDISKTAISYAKNNAFEKGVSAEHFIVLNSSQQALPFKDNFFDFVLAESCLDSMPLSIAKNYVSEIKRVCNGLVYASLIGKSDDMNADEFLVSTIHEKGTYQTVFDENKISSLFGIKLENFRHLSLINQVDIETKKLTGKRYYCVIDSELINIKQ